MANASSEQKPLGGIYDRLQSCAQSQGGKSKSIWNRLSQRLDWREWRPVRATGIAEHQVVSPREGDPWVLHDPKRDAYLRISPQEYAVWQKLDGEHTGDRLATEYAEASGTPDTVQVVEFLTLLKTGGFLAEGGRDVYAAVQEVFEKAKPAALLTELRRKASDWPLCRLTDARLWGRWQSHVGHWVTSPTVLAILAVLGVLGILALGVLLRGGSGAGGASTAELAFIKTGGSYLLGLVMLFILGNVFNILKEGGSAAGLVARGRRVPSLELALVMGFPVCRTDRRQICLLPVQERTLVELFGVLLEFGAAGAFAVCAWLWPNNLCFNAAILGFVKVFFAACPWWSSRGYNAFVDWVQVPHLRPSALSYFRTTILRELAGPPLLIGGAWLLLRPSFAGAGFLAWTRRILFLAVIAATGFLTWRREKRAERAGKESAGPQEQIWTGFLVYATLWTFAIAWACVRFFSSGAFQTGILRDLAGDLPVAMKVVLGVVIAIPALAALTFVLTIFVLLMTWIVRWLRGLTIWQDSARLAWPVYAGVMLVAFASVFVPQGMVEGWLEVCHYFAPLACLAACAVRMADLGPSAARSQLSAVGVFAALVLIAQLMADSPVVSSVVHIASIAALVVFALSAWIRERPARSARLGAVLVAAAVLVGIGPGLVDFIYLPKRDSETVTAACNALLGVLALIALTPAMIGRCHGMSANMAIGTCVGIVGLIAASLFKIAVAASEAITRFAVPVSEVNTQLVAQRWMGMQFDAQRWKWLLSDNLHIFGVLMIAASLWLLRHLGRHARFALSTCPKAAGGNAARLKSVFEFAANQILGNVAQLAGGGSAWRVAEDLATQIKVMGWPIEVKGLTVSAERYEEQEVSRVGATLSAALTQLLRSANSFLGSSVSKRLCTRIHDQIPWDDREIANTHMFGNTDWGEAVAEAPALRRDKLVETLKGTILFGGLSTEEVEALSARFHPATYEMGEVLIRQGDEGDRFFVIQTGTVEVLAEDPEGGQRVLAYLRGGDYFGEIALLANVPRTATVRAVTPVGLYSLVREDFEEATVAIGSSSEQMVDTIMDIRRLRGIPIFKGRSEGELSVLLTKLKLKTWDPDATVFQQGDAGDKFYVIRSGEVAIEASDNGGPAREVATLRAGEYFGEIALVSDVPRTASARVKTEAELWALSKDDFLELFEASQLTAQALKRTASRRLIHLSQ